MPSCWRGEMVSQAGPSNIVIPGIRSKTLNLYSSAIIIIQAHLDCKLPLTPSLDIQASALEYPYTSEQAPACVLHSHHAGQWWMSRVDSRHIPAHQAGDLSSRHSSLACRCIDRRVGLGEFLVGICLATFGQ